MGVLISSNAMVMMKPLRISEMVSKIAYLTPTVI